ncbi:hypothetical protein [Brassicibacter mesophilus]|uniref:hypothetical protein n=1 Tax=Brassicibacter mesophilus TaxID=745119 RepID=UPI003D1F52AE
MLNRKIIELLRPLRVKYFIRKMIMYLSYDLLVFSAISLLLMLISRFFPVLFIWNKLFKIGIVLCIVGIIWAIIKRPSYYDTGVLADSMGLKERVVTSLELFEDNSNLSNIQKQDTIEKLSDDELKKNISLKPPIKILVVAISLIVFSIMVGFIRTSSYEIALQQQENKQLIEKEKENIKKVEKEIVKDKQLSVEEKSKIEKKLKELRKQLNKPKDLQKLQKDILKAKKEINEIEKELKDKKIKQISDKLANKEFTRELAKKLESQDPKKVASQLQKMADNIKNSNQEELKKISKDMEALAQELSKNPELAKAFKDISGALSQNISQNADNSNLSNSMNNLQQAFSNALNDTEVLSSLTQATNALSQLNETVDQCSLQSDTTNGNKEGG